MKTLFICSQTPGLNWYRCYSFVKHMKDCKVWPKPVMDKTSNWDYAIDKNQGLIKELEKQVKDVDVVVAQRVGTAMALATLMGLRERYKFKLLCEIDDDALNVDSSNPAQPTIHNESEILYWFKKQLKESDGVIVSTEHLKEVYKPFNKNIWVIPNGIDFSYWGKPTHRKSGKIRIGWQGAFSHYDDLSILGSVIPKILKKFKNVEFYFFGYTPDYLKDIVRSFQMVTIDKYPKFLKSKGLDIILAPLQDTMFNRGKSNIRVLEAGAMEVAVVASGNDKLPYYGVLEGNKGILADNKDEWVEGISRLIEDKALRLEMGKALHDKVKSDFNVIDSARKYTEVLNEVRGIKRTPK